MPSEVVSYVDFLPTLKDQFDGFVGCPNVASQAISQNTARIKHRLAVLTISGSTLRAACSTWVPQSLIEAVGNWIADTAIVSNLSHSTEQQTPEDTLPEERHNRVKRLKRTLQRPQLDLQAIQKRVGSHTVVGKASRSFLESTLDEEAYHTMICNWFGARPEPSGVPRTVRLQTIATNLSQ